MNNFEYSKSRQLSQSNYEFQAKLVPWKPISFLQIWYFASFGPIETTKTVHLSPHIHSYLRARKEKVKREEVDRRVKESREEYSERFSPESQWVVVEEVIVVVSVFLSFCLSRQSSNESLIFLFWARTPEWDFIKFKMLFNEFSVKKLSLNDMWIFNCLCQIWLTFESAQRKTECMHRKRENCGNTSHQSKPDLGWMFKWLLHLAYYMMHVHFNTVIFVFVRTHKVFLDNIFDIFNPEIPL